VLSLKAVCIAEETTRRARTCGLLLLLHLLLERLHLLLEGRAPLLLLRPVEGSTGSTAAPGALQYNGGCVPLAVLPYRLLQPPHFAVVLVPLPPNALDGACCCICCCHTPCVCIKRGEPGGLLVPPPSLLYLARRPVLRAQYGVLLLYRRRAPGALQYSCRLLLRLEGCTGGRAPPGGLQLCGCCCAVCCEHVCV
jgi:hypothetical protein